jgi:hypothetical protein
MIRKAKIEVTVLFDDEFFNEACLSSWSLGEIESEMDNGLSIIGQSTYLGSKSVPAGRVKKELRALGNDGAFFEEA